MLSGCVIDNSEEVRMSIRWEEGPHNIHLQMGKRDFRRGDHMDDSPYVSLNFGYMAGDTPSAA